MCDVPMTHAEASKRKAETAAHNSKSKLLKSNGTVDDLAKKEGKVKVLQRSWRKLFKPLTTVKIIEDYFKNGPTIEHVKSISFEALVVLLREKPIISISKACLQRIHCLATCLHGSPCKTLAPENVDVRVFLAAFMIAYRPTHVFESMGTLEQALHESAIPLLEIFERICTAILSSERRCFSTIPPDLTKDFLSMLFEYLKRTKAWKVPDKAKLTCRIKHALIALYQAEEHLPPDELEDSKLKVEFRTQIERLRSKLQKIAGTDALTQFDEQRRAGAPPGSASGGGGSAAGGGVGGAGAASSSTGGAYAALPGRMTNEQLAHKLLLDPTFRLDENGGCSVENPVFHRIRESFHQAFWDSLVDDLKLASPCYVRVLRVLAEIRDGINDLAGSRESGNISEAVDLDFIKQQAEKGLYGWENCMRLIGAIVEVIQRVQAPKRDDETKSKWKQVSKSMEEADAAEQPRAFCKALEFLLDRVNAMRIDAANARLRLIAPVIKDHGIDYERGKLQDKLNDGSISLERTQEWIGRTVKREVAANNVDLQSLLDGKASAFTQVHSAAMRSLIADGAALKTETCPETLPFDVNRLSMLDAEFQYIVLAATMMVTVGHSLAATRNPVDAQVLATISEQFIAESRREIDVEQTVSDISKALERATIPSESKDALRRALVQCAAATDAVHQLMAQRIRTFFGRILHDGKVPADVQFISAAKPLIPRIDKAATKLRAVTNLNRSVHLPHYNRIISEEALKLRAGFSAQVRKAPSRLTTSVKRPRPPSAASPSPRPTPPHEPAAGPPAPPAGQAPGPGPV